MSNTNNTTTTWASHTFVKDHKFHDENDSNYASSTNTHMHAQPYMRNNSPQTNQELWKQKQCEKEETHNVTGHLFSLDGENLFTSFRDRQKRQQQFIIIIIVIIIIVIHFHYTIKRTNTHTHACGYGWNVKKKTFIYVHSLFTSHKNE